MIKYFSVTLPKGSISVSRIQNENVGRYFDVHFENGSCGPLELIVEISNLFFKLFPENKF